MSNFRICKNTPLQLGRLAIIVLLLSSCGQKSNTVNSGNIPVAPPPNTNPGGQLPPPPPQQPPTGSDNLIQTVKTNVPCYSGQRLNNDVRVSLNNSGNIYGSGNNVTLRGPFQDGVINGTVMNTYIGRSYWNDLIFVSKVVNNNILVGWNITISMCSMVSSYGFPYISDNRALSNFAAPYGIIIGDNTSCSYGRVISAQNTYMMSAPFQGLPQFDVWTSFASLNCLQTQ